MTAPLTAPRPSNRLMDRIASLAADIKLTHSVFALPWAILATFMAAGAGMPKVGQIALTVACMVLARTAAMSANRLVDADLDAVNPRTARRAIPGGRLSRSFVLLAIAICAAAFIGTTALFGVFYSNWIR